MMPSKPQTPNYQTPYDAIGDIVDKGSVYTHQSMMIDAGSMGK